MKGLLPEALQVARDLGAAVSGANLTSKEPFGVGSGIRHRIKNDRFLAPHHVGPRTLDPGEKVRVFASRSSKAKIKAKSVLLEKRHADQDVVGVGRGHDRFGGTWVGEKEVALLQPSWGRGFVPRDDGAGDHVGSSFLVAHAPIGRAIRDPRCCRHR